MFSCDFCETFQDSFYIEPLHKIPKFRLISWCGNFVKTHSFRRVLGKSSETLQKNFEFPQNFHTRKLGEISVFYAVNACEFLLLNLTGYLLVYSYAVTSYLYRNQRYFLYKRNLQISVVGVALNLVFQSFFRDYSCWKKYIKS